MSFFEWVGERLDPGPVGSIKRYKKTSWQPQNKILVWLLTLLGLGLFAFFTWQILMWEKTWQGLLVFAVYLLAAWLLAPHPDTRNLGWFGGLINNPFRISDNFNRWLLFFALLLLPGKLILYALQTLVNTLRSL